MEAATVKICGLQSRGMIESIINLPIDYLGLVFAKSKRQVTLEQAREIVEYVQKRRDLLPRIVGVFVNPSRAELEDVMSKVSLDVIQLHGQESSEFCQWVRNDLGAKVFKVFSMTNSDFQQPVEHRLDPYRGVIDAVMLDTYDAALVGGSGQTFAWESIPLYQAWAAHHQLPLIIAGGLNVDNIAQLLHQYQPDGVDVSSGVETDGVKDARKITTFVERVKQYDNKST